MRIAAADLKMRHYSCYTAVVGPYMYTTLVVQPGEVLEDLRYYGQCSCSTAVVAAVGRFEEGVEYSCTVCGHGSNRVDSS